MKSGELLSLIIGSFILHPRESALTPMLLDLAGMAL
jgi:hypothetical protein